MVHIWYFTIFQSSTLLKYFNAGHGGGGIFSEWSAFFASIYTSFTKTAQKGNLLTFFTYELKQRREKVLPQRTQFRVIMTLLRGDLTVVWF